MRLDCLSEFAKALELVGEIEEDEVLVSFHVNAPFSSILAKEATAIVEN